MADEIPKSVRVRTDDGNEYRFHAIQKAADFYGCNRSDAVAYACDNVTALVDGVESILSRDDLTPKQRQEIAEELSARGLQFEVSDTGGCKFVKIFATPGWRITSVCYSHQYESVTVEKS